MTEEDLLKMGDEVVDEYHAAMKELRAARERVVELCDRICAYNEALRKLESAKGQGRLSERTA